MSTIKVDTYLTRGGASEIAIDKLKGASSAGSMTVVGEGGTNTTNLQQGLSKCWWTLNGTGTIATRDSFNVSSFDDVGLGTYDANFSNNLSDGNFSFVSTTGVASNTCYVFHYHTSQAPSGGAVRFATETLNNVTAQDQSYIHGIINGDLA
jgi:hypothetical protein